MIKKIWNLEQMEKRVDNLKKIVGDTLVNICLWNNLQRTDNRLDALYMTFYDVKKLKLKYKRECFGYVNSVDYEPKFDFNQYLKKFYNYTSTTSYGYSSRTYSNYDSYTYILGTCNQI